MAKECNESHIAEQCLCNSGIASGNAVMEEKQNMFKTFYGSSMEFGGKYQPGGIAEEDWSDEEDEDEEGAAGEAEYGREANDGRRRIFKVN